MPGLFYAMEKERPVPITLFFLETVSKLTEQSPDQNATVVVRSALHECGLKSSQKEVDYALFRLQEISKQIEQEHKQPAGKPSKGLGTDLLVWLSQLRTEEMCLLLAKFDSLKAREIYRTWDRDEVTEAFRVFLGYEREKMQASFEAVLYGFGGSYKDDKSKPYSKSGNEEVYDLTVDNPEGLNELKKALRGG